MRFSSGRVLHFKTRALLSNCGTRTCHPLFSTRARMFPCLHYTRVHVALSSLHACARCTVFATRVCMLHCLRYTRAHVALFLLHACACCAVLATRVCMLHCACACCAFKLNPRAVPLNVFRYFAALNTEKCARHLSLKILSLGIQTYFVFLLRGYFPLYTQFSGQQFECFDEHVLSLCF